MLCFLKILAKGNRIVCEGWERNKSKKSGIAIFNHTGTSWWAHYYSTARDVSQSKVSVVGTSASCAQSLINQLRFKFQLPLSMKCCCFFFRLFLFSFFFSLSFLSSQCTVVVALTKQQPMPHSVAENFPQMAHQKLWSISAQCHRPRLTLANSHHTPSVNGCQWPETLPSVAVLLLLLWIFSLLCNILYGCSPLSQCLTKIY